MNVSERTKELLALLCVPEGKTITGEQTEKGRIDISVDGEYFDTYDAGRDVMLAGNLKYVRQYYDSQGYVTAAIADKEKLCGDQRVTAEISFPAAENELADACQRARTTSDRAGVVWCEILGVKYTKSEHLTEHSTIEELSFLAERLDKMTDEDRIMCKGYMEKCKEEDLSAAQLINITYNLENCRMAYNVAGFEELGEFFVEQGYIPELHDASPQVLEFIDYGKIGRKIHSEKQGVFVDEGYFYNETDEFRTVYDGSTLPEKTKSDPYIFRVKAARCTSELAENIDGIWISLPTDSERLRAVFRAIGAESPSECVLCGVQSIIPNMQYCIESTEQIELLNSLAQAMQRLGDEQSKLKAILTAVNCHDISQALMLCEHMDCFGLYADFVTYADYGKSVLASEVTLPEDMLQYFDFEKYTRDRLCDEHIYMTEYGLLKQTDMSFIPTPEQEDAEEQEF
ncbi:MAG: antirestriction protein ArdA [Clostridia bacterium]|nr:antirestriction protein ArdA [Clostridia bacterium]